MHRQVRLLVAGESECADGHGLAHCVLAEAAHHALVAHLEGLDRADLYAEKLHRFCNHGPRVFAAASSTIWISAARS